MIDKISLYCTFPEVLMQAVGERKGGTFGSLRVDEDEAIKGVLCNGTQLDIQQ